MLTALVGIANATPSSHEFVPGQVWTFHLESSEPSATLTVLKVETLEWAGEIVLVSVSAVRLPSGIVKDIRLPMSRAALDRSVIDLVRLDSVNDDLRGYETWKREKGKWYTSSVSEAMSFMRKASERRR